MFGKGIYLAGCPLKSWQYTEGAKEGGTSHTDWAAHPRTGYILMCWVELGRSKHEKKSCSHLTRAPHRTFREWQRGEDRYTSVVGDDYRAGGVLRVPEFVVYEPTRIRVE